MSVTEIAPDVYRISMFVPEIDLQFNNFLVLDDEPLLFHTSLRKAFPLIREDVSRVIDPARLRWIAYSHFEADECGAMNEWLAIAPNAQPACSALQALVSMNDFADRPAQAFGPGDVLVTGKRRFRFVPTPHLPHGWDATICFEETDRTMFCSDLFHHTGDVEPLTTSDILGRVRKALVEYQAHPLLMDYMPFSQCTERNFQRLAELRPATFATQHGSSYSGDGHKALNELCGIMREVLQSKSAGAAATEAA